MRRLVTVLALTVLAGGLLGVLAPQTQATHTGLQIRYQPPTLWTGESPLLTQSWHVDGNSLDWDDSGSNRNVFLRGYAFWSNPNPGNGSWHALYDTDWWLNCQNSLRIDAYGGGYYTGTLWLVHAWADEPWWSAWFVHDDQGWYNTYDVGMTADGDTCTWGGTHVHETHGSTSHFGDSGHGAWAKNSKYNVCCGNYRNDDPANWTRRRTW